VDKTGFLGGLRWRHEDEAWESVVRGVQKISEEISAKLIQESKEEQVIFKKNQHEVLALSRKLYLSRERNYEEKLNLYNEIHGLGYKKGGFDKKTGGFLQIHPDHNPVKVDVNKKIGRELIRFGKEVLLLRDIRKEGNSPDALINGQFWQLKNITNSNLTRGIQHAIRYGKREAGNILCRVEADNFKMHELTLGIDTALKTDLKERVENVWILVKGKLIEIKRNEILTKKYLNFFYF